MNPKGFAVVLVTAPDLKTARRLARTALEAKLAACVNLVDKIQSHYWWSGKILTDTEVLMLFKTRNSCLSELEKLIMAKHPYEVSEFIALRLSDGNRDYLSWIAESTNLISARGRSSRKQRK
jgi:periplasmic divalent cation tolerance protein